MSLRCTKTIEAHTAKIQQVHILHIDMGKKLQNLHFPLPDVDPYIIHQSPGLPHSPTQTATRFPHTLLLKYATKSLLVTMGC